MDEHKISNIILHASNAAKIQEARTQLVHANLKHAIFTALKFSNYRVPIEDLIQTAFLAMWEASATFDSSRGKFFNHAYTYMRKALNFIGITLPNLITVRPLINDIPRIKKYQHQYKQTHGVDPEIEDIATALKLTGKKTALILQAIAPVYRVCDTSSKNHYQLKFI